MRSKLLYLFLLVTFSYCADQKYPQKFPLILTEVGKNGNLAEFAGDIKTLGVNQNIIEYGFFWGGSLTENKLTISQNIKAGKYNAFINEVDLDSGSTYYVRAFIKTDNLTIYGNTEQFKGKSDNSVIERFIPTEGFTDAEVVIKGKNFSTINSNNSVTVGGFPAQVLSSSDTALKIKIPTLFFSGDYEIGVNLPGHHKPTLSKVTFKLIGGKINSFSTLSAKGGDIVSAQGEYFLQGDKLVFYANGNLVPVTPNVLSPNLIQFTVPMVVGTFFVKYESTYGTTSKFPQKFTIQ